ncbi:MAG: hypothetical protein LBL00_06910 [Endomicrobium sp.]|jgi:hypothetical protein|nr:hypothetical protein [Endomicrobium sp.]
MSDEKNKTNQIPQEFSMPPEVEYDGHGNVITADDKKRKKTLEEKEKQRKKAQEDKEEKIEALKKLATIKNIAGAFGRSQASEGCKMAMSRYEYIEIFSKSDFFLEWYWLDRRTIGGLFSEQSYKLYREGYEYFSYIQKYENQSALSKKFAEFKFYNAENIDKFIFALCTILYNADIHYIEHSIIKFVSWLQWFRYGFIDKEFQKCFVDPSMLVFYSAIGGTGKGEILRAFSAACSSMGIKTGAPTMSAISNRFVSPMVKDVNAIVIEDIIWGSSGNRDVNLDTVNSIVDRVSIPYERKGKDIDHIQPNLTIIGGTNYWRRNRRYSIIPFNERIISAEVNAPSREELKQAWSDLIEFCPSPEMQYYDVKIMNSKSPKVLSEEILLIYDFFKEHSSIETSTRKIQKYIAGREKEHDRGRGAVREALRFLEKEGAIKILYVPSNKSLDVANIALQSEEKLTEIVAQAEYRESKDGGRNTEIAAIVKRLYVDTLWDKIPQEIKRLEGAIEVCEENISINESMPESGQMPYRSVSILKNLIGRHEYLISCYKELYKYIAPPPDESPPDSS